MFVLPSLEGIIPGPQQISQISPSGSQDGTHNRGGGGRGNGVGGCGSGLRRLPFPLDNISNIKYLVGIFLVGNEALFSGGGVGFVPRRVWNLHCRRLLSQAFRDARDPAPSSHSSGARAAPPRRAAGRRWRRRRRRRALPPNLFPRRDGASVYFASGPVHRAEFASKTKQSISLRVYEHMRFISLRNSNYYIRFALSS